VSIFLADPDQQDQHDLRRAWELLDGEERSHADGLRAARDRQTYIVAHALLRAVLARETGRDAADVRFARTPQGRPELAGDVPRGSPAVRFNLSHTRGLVGCAVTTAGDVGFDVEEVRSPAPLEVAPRVFSPEELARLRALPAEQQADRFYALWTLKESYIKGRGLGLALDLGSFTVDPAPQGWAHLETRDLGEDARAWTLCWWRFARHAAALAVREPRRDQLRLSLTADLRIGDLGRR
jgi:4'-phosphopantetheinyl transferase